MATPLPAATFLAVLRAEGVTVREYRSWRTHERDDETGKTFGPVHGVVIHHTAGRDSLALCYNGTASLPGPLCHTHLSKSGVATMVSAGRANHAGTFAANAHQAVLNESSTHPRPDAAEPIDANDCYYGIEIENLGDGRDPYPAVQYEAAVRWAAAICRAHGWTANSVIGHKEGTRRKIDPSFAMDAFRAAVDERLAHAADWNPNDPDEEEPVALTAADAKTLWLTDGFVKNPNPDTAKDNPYIAPATGLQNIEIIARRTEAKLAALQATNDKLVQAVATLAANIGDLDPAAIVAELRAELESINIRIDVPDAS
ncbi:N-acetylmuramoyl-L-alanine amidase [Streptomyces sp. HC307]|uniref:N-acetylmuramoyl-L-alanine amidase n=1 Tax=Streptomyces flavusporus TaxID=3385496 RepID=UPI003916ED1E